jgi:hypothetical protein
MMPIYGYARVSTDGQSLASQDAQLRAAGCIKVYSEKISGVKTDRPELAKAIKRLDAGDVLMVTRLDRLARSTRDLLNILDAVGKAGAAFKSQGDAWADTTTPHGRLMLTVLGGLAEFERELILARTGAGRDRSHPINAVRPWSASRRAPRRQSWPAPTASRSRLLAGWLRQALSRQARSAPICTRGRTSRRPLRVFRAPTWRVVH